MCVSTFFTTEPLEPAFADGYGPEIWTVTWLQQVDYPFMIYGRVQG